MAGKLQLKGKHYTGGGWAALYSKLTLKNNKSTWHKCFHVSSATMKNS